MPKKPPVPAALSHVDARGQAHMVDVSGKNLTERVAVAEGRVIMRAETLEVVLAGNAVKGDVLGAARLAGIMAAKRVVERHRLGRQGLGVGQNAGQSFGDRHEGHD